MRLITTLFSLRSRTIIGALSLALLVGTVTVSAHRVIGRRYPTLATALVQSPNASTTDLPIPLWDTGLSVICVKVTNTSPVTGRISAIGLELPGQLRGFGLVTPVGQGVSLLENISQVPDFPGVTLDLVAVVQGGIPPATTPTRFCFSGPFDPTVPIETVLNGVFVAFQGDASLGNATDIGVWERR